MICPYTVHTEQVEQTRNEFDADGKCVFGETKTIVRRIPLECAQNQCGAFHDGKCHYHESR